MASDECVVGGTEEYDEIEEVTDIQIESEDDDEGEGILPPHYSELLLDKDTDKEIELFLRQELIPEQVVSEVVPLESKGFEKGNDQTEIRKDKQVPIKDVEDKKQIDIGTGIVVENVGSSSLGSVDDSDVLGSRNGNKSNPKVLNVRVEEVDAEAKCMNEDKKISCTKTNSETSPLWDNYILAIKGLPPRGVRRLKEVLNGALGVNRHRIKPQRKADKTVHLHFISLQDMRIAKETLNKQLVANHQLTVVKETALGQKHKLKDDCDEPSNKKMTKRRRSLQFYEETYEKQIELKMEKINFKLQDLDKVIGKNYPNYSSLLRKRRLQHGGVICALDKFKTCPPNGRIVCTCWFAIGLNEETGQLSLGIYEGNGYVRKLSSVKHYYPDHVVKTAEVFEELVRAQDNKTIWNKLLIYTNQVQDLMLLVFVDCTNDEVKCVHDEVKRFFTCGEGKNCHVTSIHTRVMNNRDSKHGTLELAMGAPCLEETIAGFKLQLPPMKYLWNCVHGAEMICKAVEELLAPSNKMTVLEVGCDSGLIGLYLSKVVGEVLSVNAESAVEVAKKNAALNGITSCRYFGGKAEDILPVVTKEQRYDKVCAVVTCCINRSYATVKAMEQLRRIQHLDRLVLVEDKSLSPSCILALSRPSKEKEMGRPLFPVKAVPVDMLNSKGYFLLILLERIDVDNIPQIEKFRICDKPVPGQTELKTKARASKKPYERKVKYSESRMRQGHGHLLLNSVWERTAFSQQSYDVGLETGTGAGQNFLFQNTDTLAASRRRFQVAEEIERAYVGAVSNMSNAVDKYSLRDMLIEEQKRKLEEECRRQVMEEQYRRWMVEEEQRRQMEEVQISQIQEEKWNRQIQMEEEWRRRIQEEERRRQIEEEEQMRQVEEEEWRRRIQEEKQRRQIQEEQMRQVEEEEWRRRIQEEKQRRQIQEEEQMKQVQEGEWKRKLQRESQRRPILEGTSRKQMEEEELRRRMGEERKRGLVRTSSSFRTRSDVVEDLIAESLREADIPQPSAETAQKLKQLLAEAIRNVGVVDQEEKQSVVSTSRGVSVIHPKDVTVSHFGRSKKVMPETRHLEEGDTHYAREVGSLCQRVYNAYGGAVGRHSYDDLKPQHCSLSRNQEINSESSSKIPSLLDLKLEPIPELSAASNDVRHPEDMGSYLDVSANQRQGRMLTAQKESDIHTKLDRLSDRSLRDLDRLSDRSLGDGKFTFSSVAEQNATMYMRRSDLDRNLRETQSSSTRQDTTHMWGTHSRYQDRQERGRRNHHGMDSAHLTTQAWYGRNYSASPGNADA